MLFLFGFITIYSCGYDKIKNQKEMNKKNDIILDDQNINDEKIESKDNKDKVSNQDPYDFEGEWCSYSFDDPNIIEMMLIIEKISEQKYRVKFKNCSELEYYDCYDDFDEIGVLEDKDLLLIKVKEKCENSEGEISYCDSTRGIEMGEWNGHPEITLYWYYVTAPETNITAEFIRCK
jgi:hypothetical protein